MLANMRLQGENLKYNCPNRAQNVKDNSKPSTPAEKRRMKDELQNKRNENFFNLVTDQYDKSSILKRITKTQSKQLNQTQQEITRLIGISKQLLSQVDQLKNTNEQLLQEKELNHINEDKMNEMKNRCKTLNQKLKKVKSDKEKLIETLTKKKSKLRIQIQRNNYD